MLVFVYLYTFIVKLFETGFGIQTLNTSAYISYKKNVFNRASILLPSPRNIIKKKKNTLLSCNYQAKTRKTLETFIVFFSFFETSEFFFEIRIQSRLMHYIFLISFVNFKPGQPHKHTVICNPCDMGILKKLEQSPYKITAFLVHCLLQHYLTRSYVSCIPCILKF